MTTTNTTAKPSTPYDENAPVVVVRIPRDDTEPVEVYETTGRSMVAEADHERGEKVNAGYYRYQADDVAHIFADSAIIPPPIEALKANAPDVRTIIEAKYPEAIHYFDARDPAAPSEIVWAREVFRYGAHFFETYPTASAALAALYREDADDTPRIGEARQAAQELVTEIGDMHDGDLPEPVEYHVRRRVAQLIFGARTAEDIDKEAQEYKLDDRLEHAIEGDNYIAADVLQAIIDGIDAWETRAQADAGILQIFKDGENYHRNKRRDLLKALGRVDDAQKGGE